MGFQFRKSIPLGFGLKLNISKSGIGLSWGTKGLSISRSPKGKVRKTISIPGTGISYTQTSGTKKKK